MGEPNGTGTEHKKESMRSLNDLIQRIVNAILKQEGMSPDHHNPGNLRGAPWLHGTNYSIIPLQGGFWLPVSRAQGVAGAAHVVALHIAQGDSLRTLIDGRPDGSYAGWAPAADKNNTEAYIQHVKEWAAIPDENLPLWNFILDPVT